MDFAPTSSQQLLAHTARTFLQQRCPPELVQSLALEPGGFAQNLWKDMSTLGWPGLLIPAELGGSGGSMLDIVTLIEEMGRACLPSPFIQSAVVATSVLLAAAPSHRAHRLLQAMAIGERIATVAPEEDSDTEGGVTRIDRAGRLAGRTRFVKDAHAATDVIVFAFRDEEPHTVLLPMDRAGIVLRPLDAIGDEKLFELEFVDVDVGGEDLLSAGARDGLSAIAMRVGALARSAEMVGCAARILDLCVEYARGRVQSGRPIGAFQAIQHHCADLLRDVEASRWLVYDGAWRMAEDGDGAAAVATAKAFCADACLRVARGGHQIMGAIGYCEEHPLHLFHKRILAASLDGGDSASHLETVARSIGLVGD